MRNLFLISVLVFGVVKFQNATAQSYCPKITEIIEKTCHNKIEDCDFRDELLFQKFARVLERSKASNPALFEKYQELLKSPATKTALKDLSSLAEEASPCVTVSYQAWSLLLKQGSINPTRKSNVQNVIRKNLLSADQYSFTWDSVRQRVMLINDALAYGLLELNEKQASEWKKVQLSFKESKALMAPISDQPTYSEKSKKVLPEPSNGLSTEEQVSQLKQRFSRTRALHEQINNTFH